MKAHPQKTPKKDPILNQLRRVEGQLGGIIKMYQGERACLEVVQQVAAVRASLAKVARRLITKEAVNCTREQQPEELDKLLKEMFRDWALLIIRLLNNY